MNAEHRIEMFDGLRLILDAEVITRFRTKKTAALLATLAYHRGRIFPRDELSAMLWPEDTTESGRNSLRIALNSLRRQLEPPGRLYGSVLAADRSSVSLNEAAFRTDVEDFLQALKGGSDQAAQLNQAIDLYRGELLPGLHDEWICAERDRLADLYLGTLERLSAALLEGNESERALDIAHRALKVDPYGEEAHRVVLMAHLQMGRPLAAQAHYATLKLLLQRDLGVEPSRETTQILKSPAIARPPRTPRARSVRQPEPAPAGPSFPRKPQRLPTQFTRFFGRESEMGKLTKLLAPTGDSCLVTLTGTAGIGKTRLALEVAGALQPAFKDRVWFVRLADIHVPGQVLPAIARAMGLNASGAADPLEQIGSHIDGLASLLVLDNFEQLAAESIPVLQQLRQRVPGLCIMVTSRRTLEASGEQTFAVPPLPVPSMDCESPADLMRIPSVQLFVERARFVRPDFTVTPRSAHDMAAICDLLEGIPLATELAAARIRVLSLHEMLRQAGQRFDFLVSTRSDRELRHRSLRAALDWSYALLSPEAREAFARLSAFRGGWTLEAAESVCDAPTMLDLLEDLRTDSLILVEEGEEATRYRMLESVREFAAEHLPLDERERASRRHFTYYTALAEEANVHLEGPEQGVWLGRLEAELANLRAAWQFLRDSTEAKEESLRFSTLLWPYWARRGPLSEGRAWLQSALAGIDDGPHDVAYVRALEGAGKLAEIQCDLEAARTYDEQGAAVCRALGDLAGTAGFLCELGVIARRQARVEEAERLWRQSYEASVEAGDEALAARVLMNLAILARNREDYAGARRLYAEALPVFDRLGDPHKSAIVMQNLGLLACEEGDFEGSRNYLMQGLALRRQIGDLKGIAFSLGALGQTALAAKWDDQAWGHYAECLDICLKTENRTGLEHCLWDLAHAWRERNLVDLSARLLGASRRAHMEIGIGLQPDEQAMLDEAIASLTQSMGKARFDKAFAEGESMSLEDAAKQVRTQLAEMTATVS